MARFGRAGGLPPQHLRQQLDAAPGDIGLGGGVADAVHLPPIVAAHAVLGNKDKIRETLEPLLEKTDSGAVITDPGNCVSIAFMDPDLAVERLLAEKARHPDWSGTDFIAMIHVTARHLITHPDMQAFYVEEGKWIPFLAKRVPEYARYTR